MFIPRFLILSAISTILIAAVFMVSLHAQLGRERTQQALREHVRGHSSPCFERAMKSAPREGPVMCPQISPGNGARVRLFAGAVVNPISNEKAGALIIEYPDEWFSRGFFSAALPGLIVSGLALLLGVVMAGMSGKRK